MADGPTPERVARVLSFLAETTGTGLDYLYTEPHREPQLLDGPGILKLWKTFQEDNGLATQVKPPRPEPYGLYFLFFCRTSAQPVPIYVGKGSLPYRALDHLGLKNQFFDQVMAYYFGGIHGRPWRDEINQPRVKERLSHLQLGFSFYAIGDNRGMKETIRPHETKFQKALHPLGNFGYHPPGYLGFDLERLVENWPRNGEGKPTLTSDELERLIATCTEGHRACIRQGLEP